MLSVRDGSVVGDAYVRRIPDVNEASIILLHPSAVLVESKPPPPYMPSLGHSTQAAINAIYNNAPNSAMSSGTSTSGFSKALSPKSPTKSSSFRV